MLKKYPYYIKSTAILLGLSLLSYAVYAMAEILIPIAFALLLSILLNPLVTRFQRWKVPHAISIILTMLIALATIIAIGYFLSTQIMSFKSDLPLLKKKFGEMLVQFQGWIQYHMGVTLSKQNQIFSESEAGIRPVVTQALGSVLGGLAVSILVPIYIFLFLFYKTLFLNFLYEVFAEENSKEVGSVLHQTKGAIQNYMVGLLVEGAIVASLNTIALFILGVKYAVMLGILGAILNVLPFIGGILAVILPLIMATATKDGMHTQIGIIIAYVIIQFIDNHFLVPWIVSAKVRINALISIVVVLLGGAVWGISGMFLSIPFIGVIKIIFDRIPELKPWGKVLGDEIPNHHKGEIWSRRKRVTLIKVEKEK